MPWEWKPTAGQRRGPPWTATSRRVAPTVKSPVAWGGSRDLN